MVVRASWRPKLPSDDLNFTAGHPWDDQTYFPWTWAWLWEPFPPVLKCINLQNRRFPTLVFTLRKGDCSAGIGITNSQAILKGKECSKSLTFVQRNVCKVSHPKKGILCSQECNDNTDTYPMLSWWWTWCERHGMEPHYLVVYFFCGVNLLKLGSEWKCIGLWLQNCYCVTYNLHKFKIHIFTPHDWK